PPTPESKTPMGRTSLIAAEDSRAPRPGHHAPASANVEEEPHEEQVPLLGADPEVASQRPLLDEAHRAVEGDRAQVLGEDAEGQLAQPDGAGPVDRGLDERPAEALLAVVARDGDRQVAAVALVAALAAVHRELGGEPPLDLGDEGQPAVADEPGEGQALLEHGALAG